MTAEKLDELARLTDELGGYGPRHGVANWTLVEYDWDQVTGTAHLTYEHDDGRTEVVIEDHSRWLVTQS